MILTKTPEYRVWSAMQQRCRNPRAQGFNRYGGRGISVCDAWIGRGGFERFIADMGRRPNASYSIDRINNDGNYEPSNCRWATLEEQFANTNNCRWVTLNGRRMFVRQWARLFGVGAEIFSALVAANLPYDVIVHECLAACALSKRIWTQKRRSFQ